MTSQQQRAVLALLNIIEETVKEVGDDGTPEGILYAALMGYGVSLDNFQSLINILVKAGKVRRSGNLLYAVK